jgi:hypothetical protein
MSLPDLLQWLGTSRKTGTLQVEFNKVGKLIHVKDGQIMGCSSNDPAQRLGHFLLSRGRITEEHLRQALTAQERTGRHLGRTLVEMNILSAEELGKYLEDKAEEIIFSMFDWNEAVFRFHETLNEQDHVFPVSLRVEDVLLRGLKRYDEMREIRSVLNDPGMVLRRTERQPPQEVFDNRMARTLYEACDGERTVAEILLHVHGSEYVVTKFLYELHRNGLVQVAGVKPVASGLPRAAATAAPTAPAMAVPPSPGSAAVAPAAPPRFTAAPAAKTRPPSTASSTTGAPPRVDPARDLAPAPPAPTAGAGPQTASTRLGDLSLAPAPGATDPPAVSAGPAGESAEDLLADWNPDLDLPAPRPPVHATTASPTVTPKAQRSTTRAPADPVPAVAPPAASETVRTAGLEALENSDAHRLHSQLEAARRLMIGSEFEAALEILDQLYRRFPGDESLRRLSAEAEAAFVEKAYRHYLPPTKIPTLTKPIGMLESEKLSPGEFFLLSRIDGDWDIKSIIQVAPLREADVLRILKRMRENGVIELRDPPHEG